MLKLATVLRILMLGIFMSVCCASAFAQPDLPGDPADGDPDVPITGIEILVGLGGAFGAKKYFDLRKKKTGEKN